MTISKLFTLLLLIVVSCLFAGCVKNQIQFNRESKFEEFKSRSGFQEQKKETSKSLTKSKGFYIYKTPEAANGLQNINFGPGEINFNISK